MNPTRGILGAILVGTAIVAFGNEALSSTTIRATEMAGGAMAGSAKARLITGLIRGGAVAAIAYMIASRE